MDDVSDGTLTQRDRIEEAHGVWELAVARVAALAEAQAAMTAAAKDNSDKFFIDFSLAVHDERKAFKDWQDTMRAELGFK